MNSLISFIIFVRQPAVDAMDNPKYDPNVLVEKKEQKISGLTCQILSKGRPIHQKLISRSEVIWSRFGQKCREKKFINSLT